MRSEGLKTIIEALVACRKPIFYAALFLLILCSVFSVSFSSALPSHMSIAPL
jgi:hypothetical protein